MYFSDTTFSLDVIYLLYILYLAWNYVCKRGERERREERLLLESESVKTIMQTDTLEMRCWSPWQQARWLGATVTR